LQKLILHANFAKGFRGGERQTQLLIEQLAQLGYKQKLLVRNASELIHRCKNIQNLQIIEISKPYIFHLKHIKDATILHAHETKALQFAYFANKLTHIPYIVTRRVGNNIKDNFLNTRMYTNAKKSVALSRAIEKEILQIAPNAATAIIPDAFTDAKVNATLSAKIKNRFKDKYLIGNIGALDGHKGQSFLLEAARNLEKTHPQMHFIFVGSGQDEEKLKAQAKGLQNITFEGFVNNVNDYINAFDLFVFPSQNEGLGSILLDVMGLNIPIIASNVGGIPDIVQNQKNGLLIEPQNAKEIEEKIIMLYKDKKFAKQLAENAKKDIKNYSPRNMVLKYQKIYEVIK
jgi:glycosyltransferase involved in cell wall biosynthesis